MKLNCLTVGMLETNCYIASDAEKNAVVVDPGGEAQRIIDWLEKAGLKPAAILLTHGHPDHTLGLRAVQEHFDVPAYACIEEKPFFDDPASAVPRYPYVPEKPKEIRYLKDGESLELLGERWELIHTPGHTWGSCCFYVPDAGVLFAGDTLFKDTYGRTDLNTGSDTDIMDSIGRKLMALPDETQVLPGHGEPTQIGRERRYNPAVLAFKRFYGG